MDKVRNFTKFNNYNLNLQYEQPDAYNVYYALHITKKYTHTDFQCTVHHVDGYKSSINVQSLYQVHCYKLNNISFKFM